MTERLVCTGEAGGVEHRGVSLKQLNSQIA